MKRSPMKLGKPLARMPFKCASLMPSTIKFIFAGLLELGETLLKKMGERV